MLEMFYKTGIYLLCSIILSSCSTKKHVNIRNKQNSNNSSPVVSVNTSTKLDCKNIIPNKTRSSLVKFCKEQQPACSSSEARSSALRRLWKLYGKNDIQTPYQVLSNNKVWVVKGTRLKAPSKTVHVIIPKSSSDCIIKEIFHKRKINYFHSQTPALKKASD